MGNTYPTPEQFSSPSPPSPRRSTGTSLQPQPPHLPRLPRLPSGKSAVTVEMGYIREEETSDR
ncbi:hypothetical protein [Coleofasciculus sp.]|uniref:hypothetical protein n=1 Tax=Coleofasciculus sp. TaxID=3100458 RepID=UPI003A3FA178